MRRPLAFVAGLLCAGAASAQPAQDGPLAPLRQGYAIEQPDLLYRQYLFGVAHGVHLLASACLGLPAHAAPAQSAYDAWNTKQGPTMARLRAALAKHYFGKRANEANWGDVARALGLKETIHPSLGKISLDEACASFAPALANERYDLARQETEVPPAAAQDRARDKTMPLRQRRDSPNGPQ